MKKETAPAPTLPEKNSDATLSRIVERWNPPAIFTGSESKSRCIMNALLPDIINASKVNNPCCHDLSSSSDTNLVSGCWRAEGREVSYFDKDKVRSLLHAITDNIEIEYKGTHHTIKCQENMLHKIYYLVLQSDVHRITPLFRTLQLHPFPEHQEMYREDFMKAIDRLYKLGTKESYTYGIFLLVLHGIFHRDMTTLHYLYSGEKLEKVIDATKPRDCERRMIPQNHEYFCDPLYSHNYSAYMFRDNYDRLYESGQLELKCDGCIPTAVLTLEDKTAVDPITNNPDPVSHQYEGTPILSKRDSLVYILMHDVKDRDATGILVFQHTDFSNKKPCFYRHGLFVSSDHKKYPEVRKIVLTERELSMEELPMVQGVLKMTSRQVIMSGEQMQNFYDTYKDKYTHLDKFTENIPRYHKNWYCFDENLVITMTNPEMDVLERLKLCLELKSYCKGPKEPFNRIHCKDSENTFKLMK